MEIFRSRMHGARARGAAHPWAGMLALARDMFGPKVFLPTKPGEQQHISLNKHQMERLSDPKQVETHLRTLEAGGNLSDNVSIDAATKRFNAAAKESLAGAGVQATTSKKGDLTLMTFNIKHGVQSSLPEIAAFINKMDNPPDLIALEEVDKGQRRSGNVDQAARLAGMIKPPMNSVFGKACHMNDGQYGVALLSRFPIKSSTTVPLGRFGDHEPRVLLKANVLINGKEVPVDVTHLSHNSAPERQWQMRKVMAAASKDSILFGDLNAQPGSPTYNMANRAFHDTWQEAGAPAGHRIDYIFTGNGIVTHKAYIPKGAGGLSDHMPRVSTVSIK